MATSRSLPSAPADLGVMIVWPEYPWLRAGFSTREGGHTLVYSPQGTAEQNLGWTPEDPAATVAENRSDFAARFHGFSSANLVTIRQVHGAVIQQVTPGVPLATPQGKAILQGDGLMTNVPGHLLGIQTADCVPVLLADTRTQAVAALHAGWRGTAARITEHGVEAMCRDFGSRTQDLIAAIGPAIGPCCFAVGDEVQNQFHNEFAYASELITTGPIHSEGQSPIHVNLWEANRRQLLSAGVAANAITVVGECTACTRTASGKRKYFSHRAERGYTGRMLSVIGVPNT